MTLKKNNNIMIEIFIHLWDMVIETHIHMWKRKQRFKGTRGIPLILSGNGKNRVSSLYIRKNGICVRRRGFSKKLFIGKTDTIFFLTFFMRGKNSVRSARTTLVRVTFYTCQKIVIRQMFNGKQLF